MLSDVLFDAVERIRRQQQEAPGYYGLIRPEIDAAVMRMNALREFLDHRPDSEEKYKERLTALRSLLSL